MKRPSWREQVLSDLIPGLAPVTLVADPDCLLLDEELLGAIRGRGFDLLTFEDPVAFRLSHESRFRSRSASGHGAGDELLLRFNHDDLRVVPYDLLQAGRPLRFTLSELFPGLSHPVLAALDRADLDAVYQARPDHEREELGENATKDFVLRHVFGIRPAEIRCPADLLHVLLRRHYRGLRVPPQLDERLVEVLRCSDVFASWPLESLGPDREAFFTFLQERWPVFLDGSTGGDEAHDREAKARYGLRGRRPPDRDLAAGRMTRAGQIGFSQRIQLDWLEYTANLVLAGNTKAEIAAELNERLREKLSVGNEPRRGTRHKATTILTKVWVNVPSDREGLKNQGMELLQRASPVDRMFIHWCMCMAAYPFFATVAHPTGRLLRLQGTAGAAQVQRRIREQLGERETVARATRRILRTFIDWGVLRETAAKGVYDAAAKRVVDRRHQLGVWAIQAVLAAKGGRPQSASTLLRGPHMFPFDAALPSAREIETCDALELRHHGPDHEVLIAPAGHAAT